LLSCMLTGSPRTRRCSASVSTTASAYGFELPRMVHLLSIRGVAFLSHRTNSIPFVKSGTSVQYSFYSVHLRRQFTKSCLTCANLLPLTSKDVDLVFHPDTETFREVAYTLTRSHHCKDNNRHCTSPLGNLVARVFDKVLIVP
jgi:hypothetical protein